MVRLQVSRYFCDASGCAARTFAEQIPGVSVRHGRRTPHLTRMLVDIGLALAGRAGSRLAATIGLPAGRNVLLRLVRALPDRLIGAVSVLGVDDFALRRGHRYGTILIDMDTHRPIDVLDDRLADTFAAWLEEHPGVTVVCRDRGGAYAEGARTGAPQAIQVADRWHLWKNLAEQVEKTVAAHHGCIRTAYATPTAEAADEPDAAAAMDAAAVDRWEGSAIVARTKERYAAVQALKAQGKGIKAIRRELGLAKETVRKFYRAASVDELLVTARAGRCSILDPFKPFLHDAWNAGRTNVSALYREIVEQGYRGSYATVCDYLGPFRTQTAPPPAPTVPKVRRITSWLLSHPDHLDTDDQVELKQVRAACPELDTTAARVATFAQILTELRGEELDAWMTTVEADDLPHLHRFVRGLRADNAAVVNGLTLPHNSGAVEGAVNRIKMMKRQMYGRAKFDLLRKRILHAA
ncbi:ISL3 family transposase [Virgisporangium aurantiacum]|uniref:ISL3 family transposase n=2 Tax=Virgisporangium aurantiacum TaxID=175570 RepID=A0A8J3ZEY7_9ACTN|nr:ISL3 family transposase [Virgisporangium aurantiacum]